MLPFQTSGKNSSETRETERQRQSGKVAELVKKAAALSLELICMREQLS